MARPKRQSAAASPAAASPAARRRRLAELEARRLMADIDATDSATDAIRDEIGEASAALWTETTAPVWRAIGRALTPLLNDPARRPTWEAWHRRWIEDARRGGKRDKEAGHDPTD